MKHKFTKGIIGLAFLGMLLSACTIIKPSESKPEDDFRYQIYQLAVEQNGYTGTYQEWLDSIKGEDGKDGQDGHSPVIIIGSNGNWFIDGVDTGVKAQGERGPQGEPGSNGQNGSEGPQGPKGDDGTSVLTGSGVPSDDLGHNGDSYINLQNWDYYVKENGTWVLKGNIKGNAGTPGVAGSDGKSAYEIYCETHPDYTKTEEEWLDDLVNGRLGNQETYTVTFDSRGGSQVDSQEVTYGGKAHKPDNPTLAGYTFVEWVDADNEHWVFSGYSITEDITLYAVWEANTYTITLNPNEGSVENASIEVKYMEDFVLPVATRTGYKFGGWYIGEQKIESGVYNYLSNLTLTAKWNPLFTIHFDSTGGNDIDDYVGTGSYDVALLPTPTKEDYQFNGWYYNDTLVTAPFTYTYEQEEITLVAKWKMIAGDFIIDSVDEGTIRILGYTGSDTVLNMPSTLGGKSVVEIGDEVFKNNSSITKIVLPNTVTKVGDEAFANMSSLDEIVLDNNLTTVGQNILLGSTSLTKISMKAGPIILASFFDYEKDNIPNDLTVTLSYGGYRPNSYAFKNIGKRFSVILDNSWTSLTDSCFESTPITSIEFSETVTNIGHRAFYGCSNIQSITIPNNVVIFGEDVFDRCYNLASINLPSNLTYIPAGMFSYCTALKTFVIPSGITRIDSTAFSGSGLSAILIPSSVTQIKTSVFSGTSLKNVFYTGTKAQWNSISVDSYNTDLSTAEIEYESSVTSLSQVSDSNYSYVLTNDNRVCDFRTVDKSMNEFNFETDLPGLTISSLADYAFRDCVNLPAIAIPSGVKNIGQLSFYGCTNMSAIAIPKSIKTIQYNVFSEYDRLQMILYEGTEEEWNQISISSSGNTTLNNAVVVCGCEGITGFTRVSNDKCTYYVTNTGLVVNFCLNNKSLTEFDFATELPGLTVLGLAKNAFNGTQLTSINLPDSIVCIPYCAFMTSTHLTGLLKVPQNCERLDYSAFANTGYTSAIIPVKVKKIDEYVFDGDAMNIYYEGTETQWNQIDYNSSGNYGINDGTIYFYSELEPSESGNYWHYVGGVPTVW